MCVYRNGKISSVVLEELQGKHVDPLTKAPISNQDADMSMDNFSSFNQTSQPTIEVNARDFLASLSRIIQINDVYFRRIFENDTVSMSILVKQLDLSVMGQFNSINVQSMLPRIDQNLMHHPRIDDQDLDDTSRTIQEGDRKMKISDAVVATLAQQLVKEDKLAVKETIAAALGQIAKPDALHNMCFDCLIKAFSMARSSEEATLKSMIVWTMGRLSTFETGQKFKKCLIAAL